MVFCKQTQEQHKTHLCVKFVNQNWICGLFRPISGLFLPSEMVVLMYFCRTLFAIFQKLLGIFAIKKISVKCSINQAQLVFHICAVETLRFQKLNFRGLQFVVLLMKLVYQVIFFQSQTNFYPRNEFLASILAENGFKNVFLVHL